MPTILESASRVPGVRVLGDGTLEIDVNESEKSWANSTIDQILGIVRPKVKKEESEPVEDKMPERF